jgi:hypothetical protein
VETLPKILGLEEITYSMISHGIVWYKFTDCSEENTVSIFTVEK